MYTNVLSHKGSCVRVLTFVALMVLVAGMVYAASADDLKSKRTGRTSVIETAPYLVINMSQRVITVKLASVVLREYAFVIADDSAGAASVVGNTDSNRRTVKSVHLLTAAKTISEAELQIISEETGLGADMVQRFTPASMVLVISDGSRIYVEADCPDAESFLWERVKEVFRRIWYGLIGGDSIGIQLSPEDAMSLYGIALGSPAVIFE